MELALARGTFAIRVPVGGLVGGWSPLPVRVPPGGRHRCVGWKRLLSQFWPRAVLCAGPSQEALGSGLGWEGQALGGGLLDAQDAPCGLWPALLGGF